MVRFMRYGQLFRLYEQIQPYLKYSLPLEESLPGKTVLVIAPHPDDEAIGCGGALALHARSGTTEIVYCASGGEIREKEAREASHVLGAQGITFLRYPVGTLSSQEELPGKIAGLIDEKKPSVIMVPFILDNHDDHRGVNKALVKAFKIHRFDGLVYAYPVWFPVYPNVLIDISSVWETKKKAISLYASQTATRDYVSMSYALGTYWAGVKGHGCAVVESFFRATPAEYTKLFERINR